MKVLAPILFGLLLAGPAFGRAPLAEVICQPTATLHDRLARQYGAQQSGGGLRSPEEMLEIWITPRGDWTVVMTYAQGLSCIVAMGQDWTQLPDNPA